MNSSATPEIVLYDLASIKNVCFSPVVWKIRLMLNFKGTSCKTVFLRHPDIEPEPKRLKQYTVPAIHHVPSDPYIMDSVPVSEFLEKTYSEPPLPLSSVLGDQIVAAARKSSVSVTQASVTPRDIRGLCPRSQTYFRRTREAVLGRRLEQTLEGDNEEQARAAADAVLLYAGELMLTNQEKGCYIEGSTPSYADFAVTGWLQCVREVDEDIFKKYAKCPGYMRIYNACFQWVKLKRV